MPAIRDISWNTTTVATGTTLVISRPSVEVDDLMLAIITADTGTQTWSSSGWTVLFSQTNTAQQTMLYKIAVAGDLSTASYTFTATASESFNGCIITIQDVNTTNPFGNPVVRTTATQAAAAKYTMSTITTNVANSLIIYAATNSGTGVPSLLEGPVYGILGADGVAESMGVGWGFQPTIGTTGTVTCSNVATGAGLKTTLQIAPPATGAVIVPTYCAADSSLYINPINGTTAYNGDTALAATADTNYGVTLGGFSAGDATVSAVTDVGINSFHSVGRLTSISGSQNLSGAELVLATANRPNVTGKNILVHIGPSTEGQLQRFSTISSNRGFWFGMRSAVGNNKIWQVYGVEKGSTRHVPVVINSAAGNTKHSGGTLDASAIQSFGFWVSGTGVNSTAWDVASLWVLDTTTLAGGNAAYPINLEGITAAAATGKERKSVLLQGSGQLLVLQPIQFGNGGTNATYLNLSTTAIEFPSQYNQAAKQVTYNSVDNVAGITYFAGASDTIIHSNSVVSSTNQFHWRIHASSSTSATYNFSGLSIIGAGDVVLRAVTTFSNMVFASCATITQNSAIISSCEFESSYLLANAPNNISGCSFTSSGTGHAIEITAPGTYTFSGNLFSGYGSTGTTNAAIYNNSGGSVTLNISGGGDVPTYRNGAGASTSVVAAANVTLTGLVAGSEVRAYLGTDPATATAIDGIESSTTSFTFSQSSAGSNGYIVIFNTGYLPIRLAITYSGSDVSIPIQQTVDRNYQP